MPVLVGFLLAVHLLGIVVLFFDSKRHPPGPKPWGWPWSALVWPFFVTGDLLVLFLERRRNRRRLDQLKRDVWGRR